MSQGVMGEERESTDITLQLLAKAGEIAVQEQNKMPSAVLASRLRSMDSVSALNSGMPNQILSRHAASSEELMAGPGHQKHALGNESTQRQETQGARGRQKDGFQAASTLKEGHAADNSFRDTAAQLQPVPTKLMKQLGVLPIRRAWRGRSGEASPDITHTPVVEAIMLHERGEVQLPEQQCSKCREGEGASPECVKIPGIHNGACSNCLIARALVSPGSTTRPIRSYSAERRSISATMPPSIPKEDLIAVWNLIAGVISTQPQECFFDDGTETPGKRIEDAARLVARSADEWGHTVSEDGPESGKPPRTETEKGKLVRQATRIRETALEIASCARDWGEKLEKKRSTSQLRT
ncbi:uncharacterized protein CTRU02_202703 [Colletotrichum truncatum]|uniref:Uncharacterized protein n=1 Tax=Colletotrichum truncatum TaxID=5467 RepID=A0ACC3ZKZ2_COLTU